MGWGEIVGNIITENDYSQTNWFTMLRFRMAKSKPNKIELAYFERYFNFVRCRITGFPVRGIREFINLALTYKHPNNLVLHVIYAINLARTYAGPIMRTQKCRAPCHPT